jgi:hypothetical protein
MFDFSDCWAPVSFSTADVTWSKSRPVGSQPGLIDPARAARADTANVKYVGALTLVAGRV